MIYQLLFMVALFALACGPAFGVAFASYRAVWWLRRGDAEEAFGFAFMGAVALAASIGLCGLAVAIKP